MKRSALALLMLPLLLFGHSIGAQTTCNPTPWCVASVNLSMPTAILGGAEGVAIAFQASAAATNVTLDTEIYDPSGTRVAQSWQTGANFTAGQTQFATTLTYSVTAAVAGGAAPALGTYSVRVGVFSADGTNVYWNNAAASFNVSATAPVTVPLPALPVYVPDCYPSKLKIAAAVAAGKGVPVASGVIPDGISVAHNRYSVWVCDMGTGYKTVISLFTSQDNTYETAWNYAFGTVTAVQAAADCAAHCIPATATELPYIEQLGQQYRPRAVVSVNGKLPSRSVYVKKPDGKTRNTTPVGPMVAIGVACDEADRIAGTNFYSVWNQLDTTGMPLPHVYVDCGVPSFPLAAVN